MRDGCGYSEVKMTPAESRKLNTKNEVKFLAGAYYDCAVWVYNSGFRDISMVNQQFEHMVNNYVRANKIKQESYNKFMLLTMQVGFNGLNVTREKYISNIMTALESSENGNFMGGKLLNEFRQFIAKTGIKLSKEKEELLFIELFTSVGRASGNEAFLKAVEEYKNKLGISGVIFDGPRIVTYNDGCSTTRYGNIYANWDKYKKY